MKLNFGAIGEFSRRRTCGSCRRRATTDSQLHINTVVIIIIGPENEAADECTLKALRTERKTIIGQR